LKFEDSSKSSTVFGQNVSDRFQLYSEKRVTTQFKKVASVAAAPNDIRNTRTAAPNMYLVRETITRADRGLALFQSIGLFVDNVSRKKNLKFTGLTHNLGQL
jgi:hypothetical protein